MTDCERISDSLIDYINRRLTQEQNGEIVSHLAVCHSCRREAADLIRFKKLEQERMADVPQEIMDTAFLRIPKDDKFLDDIIDFHPYHVVFNLIRYSLTAVNQTIQLAQQAI